MDPNPDQQDVALEVGGMVSTLTVLKVLRSELPALRAALRETTQRAPGLFDDALIALDLSAIDGPGLPQGEQAGGSARQAPLAPLDLEALVAMLRNQRLVPVALCDPREERQAQALAIGLGVVHGGARRGARRGRPAADASATAPRSPEPTPSKTVADSPPATAETHPASPSLMLYQPVRGGQVAYAEGADAVALAAVNPGGELIADGNIHIYGALRGRALAGARGNLKARVFCTRLEPELVSVAGVYLQADQIPESHRGKPAQVYLEGDALVVANL